MDRSTSEKELWESKYDQKRRALKDIEIQLSAQIQNLEKQNNQLKSQITHMQHEHDALNSDHLSEATSLRQQLVNMDTSAGHAFFMGSAQQEDMIRLKGQLQECEREL